MRFTIQRVTHASVKVDGQIVGQIGKGFLVLVGISDEDSEAVADKMVAKMVRLRIFDDENGKTNLDLAAVNGSLLIVSQFTVCGCASRQQTIVYTRRRAGQSQ